MPARRVRRVLIAHTSPVAARAMGSFLGTNGDLELAGLAHKLTQTLALIEVVRPEVVMLDLGLAGENFLQVLRWVKLKVPASIVIVLSPSDRTGLRLRCLEAGADYFCKDSLEQTDLTELTESLDYSHVKREKYEL